MASLLNGPEATEASIGVLRSLRATLGLSQEQLARELGVSYVTVNRWESGRARISPAAAKRLEAFRQSIAGRGLERFGQQLTSFVGRGAELAELESNLAANRLVTLVGPGGVGKTRLARELLARLEQLRQVMVSLENAFSRHDAVAELAAALGLRDRPGEDPVAGLAKALSSEPTLVFFDGAERLCSETASLVTELLESTANLRLLVTSRQLLGVQGERVQSLGPLRCPPADLDGPEVNDFEAVALFLARARQRLPELAAQSLPAVKLSALCRSLDGLPLAIELLAGWIGTLSLDEILERSHELLGASDDSSGLRNVVERSWLLLDERQRRFLASLSVLRGAFSLPDAACISGFSETDTAVLLRSLVESSWLLVEQASDENRLRLLETMRGFLIEKLSFEEQSGLSARHGSYFEQLAIASEAGVLSPQASSWSRRIAAAWPDLETAISGFCERGEVDRALRTAASLWPWWLSQGRLALGRQHLDLVLKQARNRDDEPVARANCAAAVLAVEHGAYSEGIERAMRSRRAFKSYGARAEEALTETVLGSAYRYLDELSLARQSFGAALEIRRQLGEERGVAVALNNLALLALDAGSYEEAEGLFSESIALKRRLGNTRSIAIGLSNLSTVLIRLGRQQDAGRVLFEAAKLAGDGDDLQLRGSIEANLGELSAAKTHWEDAVSHFESSASAQRQGGHAHDTIVALVGLGQALARLGEEDRAMAALREAEQLAVATGNRAGLNKTRAVIAGLAQLPRGILPGGLTHREAQVLEQLALGATNKAIAQRLGLSCSTVEHHLTHIYKKISASNRVAAARWAVARGLDPSKSPEARREP